MPAPKQTVATKSAKARGTTVRHFCAFCAFCGQLLLGMAAATTASASGQATVWSRWEQTLTSTRDHANPYRDVTLRVTFSGPGGRSFTGYGFWDGGKTFRLRAAFPAPGEWTWTTTSSDPTDTGLHAQSGRVTVTAYTGDNPVRRHGFLRVSDNHRHLAHADGTPFLWVGDTPWSAFIAATGAEWEEFLDNRRAHRFTVMQVHCGDGFVVKPADRAGHPPFLGAGAELRANPAYWRGVEEKVRAANDRGLLVYICAVRQPGGYRGKSFPMNDETEVARFARHLAARLMGDFVMYSPIADDEWSAPADACGRALDEATSQHLISAHPRFLLEPALAAHSRDYIDVVGFQSGEGWTHDPYKKEPKKPFSTALAAQNAYEWPLLLYQLQPAKPLINQEGPYDHPVEPDGRVPLPPHQSGYWSFLNGAPGLTYGCFGIWNWGKRINWMPCYDFPTALAVPSVRYMKHLATFFGAIRWWTLVPRPELVRHQSDDPLRHLSAAASPAGDLVVAYLPDNAAVTLDLAGFPAGLHGRWFNPLTGDYAPAAGTTTDAANATYTKPSGWPEAVLLLERAQ